MLGVQGLWNGSKETYVKPVDRFMPARKAETTSNVSFCISDGIDRDLLRTASKA